MRSILSILVGVIFIAVNSQVHAQSAARTASPVVVELFTSQSCSSCVPAAHFLAELSKRSDVIALGWHVDYWNNLRTRDGQWVDPFSSADYTERQRRYNMNIRKRQSVYTPQMVVNGIYEMVGSRRRNVTSMIDRSRGHSRAAAITAVRTGEKLSFSINGKMSGDVLLVSFKKSADTDVKGGENAGVYFNDVNIVSNVERLGTLDKNASAQFSADAPAEGYGCALLVQAPDQGAIINAAYCAE